MTAATLPSAHLTPARPTARVALAAAPAGGQLGADRVLREGHSTGVAPRLDFTGGNRAALLVDAPAASAAIIDAVRGARELVNVAMFSLQHNGSGYALGEALEQKAREGVEVNLVIDAAGSKQIPFGDNWKFTRELQDAGANVIVTSAFSPRRQTRVVDHRKVVVVDGRTAFVGGMNFAKTFDDWHDTMVRYEGPAAAQTGQLYLDRWRALGGSATARHTNVVRRALHDAAGVSPDAPARAAMVETDPKRHDYAVLDYHLDRIRSAQRRVWLMTPFIGDREVVDELAAAARRGVDVRVATSSTSTLPLVPFVPLFTRSFYDELIDAGARVFEVEGVSHAKALIADDETTVGSYNASRRAGYHDTELNLVVRDTAFQRQVERLFDDDFARSRQFSRDDLDGTVQRIFNAVTDGLNLQY